MFIEGGLTPDELKLILNIDPTQVPRRFRKPWLNFEDEKLLSKVKELGQNWVKIQNFFTGHNEEDCR